MYLRKEPTSVREELGKSLSRKKRKYEIMDNLGKHMQGGLTYTENDVLSHTTDLFRPIQQEVSMIDSNIICVRPISMNQAGPYTFNITPKGEQYIHMNRIRLYIAGSVTSSTGAALIETDNVGVCNLLGNSLIQTIELEIGGKQIGELQNTHANYKSYLETLLSYGEEAKDSHLTCGFWVDDSAFEFDDCKYHLQSDEESEDANEAVEKRKKAGPHPLDSKNKGYRERRVNVLTPFDLMIPLHCDFFNSDKLLPPGVELVLKLTRAKDDFLLMQASDSKYRINLSSIKLYIPYITLAEPIVAAHKRMIQSGPILLPIKKTEILVHHFAAGLTNVFIPNQFQNRLPKSLIVGMLDTDSYNGTAKKNPYNFKHFSVNHVQIIKNGCAIPNDAYSPDWENKLYNRELRCFFDNIGVGTDNNPCSISSKLYAGGCTFFAFDLSPDKCNGYHWHAREEGGSIDIDLRFKEALPSGGMTVMLFAVFDAAVTIDKDNQVAVAF